MLVHARSKSGSCTSLEAYCLLPAELSHFQGSTEPLNIGGLPPARGQMGRGLRPIGLRSPFQGGSPRQHLIQQGALGQQNFQAEALPKGQTKTIYQVQSKRAVLTFHKNVSSISKRIQVLHLIHHLHPSLWLLIGHGLLPD